MSMLEIKDPDAKKLVKDLILASEEQSEEQKTKMMLFLSTLSHTSEQALREVLYPEESKDGQPISDEKSIKLSLITYLLANHRLQLLPSQKCKDDELKKVLGEHENATFEELLSLCLLYQS